MVPIIVVEGPDGAGKTTLIKKLLERFDKYTVAPRVVNKDTEAMVDLKEWVELDNMASSKNTLYDRHRLISEPIYGPIMRPQTPEPGFDNIEWFYEELAQFYAKKPVIIYCLPALSVVQANVRHDPDNTAVAERITSVWQGYLNKACTDFSAGRAFMHDYTTHSTPRLLSMVDAQIQRRKYHW